MNEPGDVTARANAKKPARGSARAAGSRAEPARDAAGTAASRARTAPPGTALSGAGRLAAELKALGKVHGEAVAQHNRVYEALLGIGSPAEPAPLLRLPTFEDLFDERVSRSLERLGIAKALAALQQQQAAIDAALRRLDDRIGQLNEPRAPRNRR